MKVVGNTIVQIEESDIINGTFKLPEGISVIGEMACESCPTIVTVPEGIITVEDYAFADCPSLTSLPNSIRSVGNNAFRYCQSLTTLSANLKTIGDYAFWSCESIKEMPDSVEIVGQGAFANCKSLRKLSDNLTTIGNAAFQDCTSLTELPESIETIGTGAFYKCINLKKIPNHIKKIGSLAFLSCSSLTTIYLGDIETIADDAFDEKIIQTIITPYGSRNIQEYDNHNVIANYLYLYANSILKEKYDKIEGFLENKDIEAIFSGDVIYKKNSIQKFKNLFFKMRKTWDISAFLFNYMSLSATEKFDIKTWGQIKNIIDWRNSQEMSKAFAEMLEVFGVFVKDSKQQKRIDKLEQLLDATNFVLTNHQNKSLFESHNFSTSSLPVLFQKKDIAYYKYMDTETLPEEFAPYLQHNMSEEQVHVIKKLTGTYGSQIQKFFHEHYDKIDTRVNVLSSEGIQSPTMKNAIFSAGDSYNFANYENLHRIFNGCAEPFNPEFYEFFIENLPIILHNKKMQSYVRNIQKKFNQIKSHYLYTSGTTKINLKQALDYLKNERFVYHPGNAEVAMEVQNAGVVSQVAFDYYQEAFEKNQVRRKTSLVKRKNIYEINGFKIKAELLRKDEIEAALVGEVNNTNCCQVYNGIGHNCMAHAVYSDDGGVFVTKLIDDDKEILLTQSWDWQNNNVYCHDNIESTPYLDDDKKLRAAVAKVFQLDGEYIIEKSKVEVENYIIARKKTIERSLMSETEKEKELSLLREMEERQVIRVVTSGEGNDDLGLSEYFTSSISVDQSMLFNNQKFTLVNFQPVNYNKRQLYFNVKELAYTDSRIKQYVIAGSLENLCLGKQEPLVPIYRDKRRVVVEEKVRDYTFHKVQTIEKEAYPEEMQQHQDIGRDQFIEEGQNVYLGEDWYMIYEQKDDQTIYISDLAKINPSLEDESGEQIREMSTAINNLLEQYEIIEADLKEDTSYLLYLMNKKRGIVEQIGEDKVYSFGSEEEQRVVDSKEQEKILKNIKEIRNQKNPKNMMHHVIFQKGPRWKNEISQTTRKR